MTWQTVPNLMGQTPTYGLAGFNNVFNNYTWIMEVWNESLYVGTMDHSYLVLGLVGDVVPEELQPLLDNIDYGADLYRFDDSDSSAVAVSLDGMGNPMNYGIRTSISGSPMYLGTANPMNLNPDGGWELIKVTVPTCEGSCGEMSPTGCWCDELCEGYGDCCEDVCDECPDLSYCVAPGGDCQGFCGRQSPAGCWCDEACESYGDCCEAVCDDCSELSQCQPPPPVGSCEGYCGRETPEGCWCDEACAFFGDCCPDIGEQCVSPADSCSGKCGQYDNSWSCQCDAECTGFGDCCSDYQQLCQ